MSVPLNKGDHVWLVLTMTATGMPGQPLLEEYVVVAAGPIRVRLAPVRRPVFSQVARRDDAEHLYQATPLEAIEAAKEHLKVVRERAMDTYMAASNALGMLGSLRTEARAGVDDLDEVQGS
jgi:hypothetical protein